FIVMSPRSWLLDAVACLKSLRIRALAAPLIDTLGAVLVRQQKRQFADCGAALSNTSIVVDRCQLGNNCDLTLGHLAAPTEGVSLS
ncbi:MAG TPA: hypothetical protein VE258_12380, partial [Ktedonobacterales bacterium]|nr:hypothetical protein [Ktedonobacterales bacterium]